MQSDTAVMKGDSKGADNTKRALKAAKEKENTGASADPNLVA